MRMTRTFALCMLLSTCVPMSPAAAQLGTPTSPMSVTNSGRQEVAPMIRASVSNGAFTVWGGNYLFSQACTSYNSGALTLTTPGPGGVGTITMISKTTSDTTTATVIQLGSNAVVTATPPSGSTGCNADLSRIP